MAMDSPQVGLNRVTFRVDYGTDAQTSINNQLQEFLQMILDKSNTIISVQQTSEGRVSSGSRVGALEWQEYLIISEQ